MCWAVQKVSKDYLKYAEQQRSEAAPPPKRVNDRSAEVSQWNVARAWSARPVAAAAYPQTYGRQRPNMPGKGTVPAGHVRPPPKDRPVTPQARPPQAKPRPVSAPVPPPKARPMMPAPKARPVQTVPRPVQPQGAPPKKPQPMPPRAKSMGALPPMKTTLKSLEKVTQPSQPGRGVPVPPRGRTQSNKDQKGSVPPKGPMLKPRGSVSAMLPESVEGNVARSRTPRKLKLPPGWEEHWHKDYCLHYYWNRDTGDSLWDPPT
eukprot:symbB.v1.2.003636.t1/scaffold203.1/size271217/28